MTVTEAAERIGISPSKVYQLVAQRLISHYRIGGKIILKEEDIASYLDDCRVGAITLAVASPHMPPRLKHLSLHR